jgi:hypothetical protein
VNRKTSTNAEQLDYNDGELDGIATAGERSPHTFWLCTNRAGDGQELPRLGFWIVVASGSDRGDCGRRSPGYHRDR